jgi:hypothetical protein
MQVVCEPYSEFNGKDGDSFAWVPLHWRVGEMPNVMVARLNREPLEPETVEDLTASCARMDWVEDYKKTIADILFDEQGRPHL